MGKHNGKLKKQLKKKIGEKLFPWLLRIKQVAWTRIAAVEVYIRKVEKYLMGKTGKYQSKLLRSNVLHLPLQALRTYQTSVTPSLDTASLASNWGVKIRWTF